METKTNTPTGQSAAPSAGATGSAYARRKARAEAQVIAQVKEFGGFSVFWATENMERARAINRLHWKLGVIAPKKGRGAGQFPWCGYKLNTQNAPAHRPAREEPKP